MPVDLLKETDECLLILSGVVDVFDAAALHAAALEAAQTTGRVVVRLDRAHALDTSTMQVILALKRALEARARTLRFEGTPGPVAAQWRLAGLESQLT